MFGHFCYYRLAIQTATEPKVNLTQCSPLRDSIASTKHHSLSARHMKKHKPYQCEQSHSQEVKRDAFSLRQCYMFAKDPRHFYLFVSDSITNVTEKSLLYLYMLLKLKRFKTVNVLICKHNMRDFINLKPV